MYGYGIFSSKLNKANTQQVGKLSTAKFGPKGTERYSILPKDTPSKKKATKYGNIVPLTKKFGDVIYCQMAGLGSARSNKLG